MSRIGTRAEQNLEPYREHLLLEAVLAASNLATGLTSIRRYSFANKGAFFTALFAFTIGLERLLKLIVILDHYHQHLRVPCDDELKKLGHDLGKLVERAQQINVEREFSIDTTHVDDGLVQDAVTLLARFARESRYYNLNVITGSKRGVGHEPLAEWDRKIGQALVRRHHRWTRARRANINFGKLVAGTPGIVIQHVADDGSGISDFDAMVEHAILAETKQKYATFYLQRLADFCISVLERLDYMFSMPLYVGEPFRSLSTVPRKMALRRKIWKPYL